MELKRGLDLTAHPSCVRPTMRLVETEVDSERFAMRSDADHCGDEHHCDRPDAFPRRGRAGRQGRGIPEPPPTCRLTSSAARDQRHPLHHGEWSRGGPRETVVRFRRAIESASTNWAWWSQEHRAAGSTNDQILVQFPMTDVDRARDHPRRGFLSSSSSRRKARRRRNWRRRRRTERDGSRPGRDILEADSTTYYYLVKKVAAVNGRDLRSARPSLDEKQSHGRELHAQFGGAASSVFTGENIKGNMIVLDGRQSAPTIDYCITTDGRIS